MPVITLPDGSQRSFDSAVSVHAVAADIGPAVGRAVEDRRRDGEAVDREGRPVAAESGPLPLLTLHRVELSSENAVC